MNATKRSMRNTPANKVRRIEADLVLCLNALERLEGESDEDGEPERTTKTLSLKAHISRLESQLAAWRRGGPRAR